MVVVNSDTEPMPLQLDRVKNGKARVLVRWDIQQVEKVDPMTEEVRTIWEYEEKIMQWILDRAYKTTQDVETYLETEAVTILGFAQAAKMVYGTGDE
jgi:hypothetical protein